MASQLEDIILNAEEKAKEESPKEPIKEPEEDVLEDLEQADEVRKSIFLRTSTLLPMDKLAEDQVRIIGIGGIGRPLAMQLVSLGVGSVVLYDDDIVTETNISTQGYPFADLDDDKVSSLLTTLGEIVPDGDFMGYDDRFPLAEDADIWATDNGEGPIFCCVDEISIRAEVFRSATPCPLFIDGRMGAQIGRFITILMDSKEDREYYESTLFPQSEQEELPCTAKATIYCGNFIAALMVTQYTRYMKGLIKPNDRYRDMMFNLPTFDMFPFNPNTTSSVAKLSTKDPGKGKKTRKGKKPAKKKE
jgi:hypothetical protein